MMDCVRFVFRGLAFAPALFMTSAIAGVTPTVGNGSVTPAVGDGSVTIPAVQSHSGSGAQLRCWQEGRLLFEEVGWSLPPGGGAQLGQNHVRFSSKGGRSGSLYLIPLGKSLCVYQGGN